MKKTVFAIIGWAVLSLSCGKTTDSGCQPATVASEKAAMAAYCTANNINYTEHSSGILYEIVSPGTGAIPSVSSTVSVLYTLKNMSNVTIEASANPYTNRLSYLIEGWKIAIPLLRAGGKIKMVIPSALGYSCVGSSNIPPNSPLFFEVTLVAVQ